MKLISAMLVVVVLGIAGCAQEGAGDDGRGDAVDSMDVMADADAADDGEGDGETGGDPESEADAEDDPPYAGAGAGAGAVAGAGASTAAQAAPVARSRNVPRGSRPLPRNAFLLRPTAVMDKRGFAKPIAAAYVLIPAGWAAQGEGVVWGPQYSCTFGYNYEWSARSPDGASEVAVLPMIGWSTSNYGGGSSASGCPSLQVGDVKTLIEMMARTGKPGARFLEFRRRRDMEAQLAGLNVMQPIASGDVAAWTEVGELRFAFQENGRDMHGYMMVVATLTRVRSQMLAGADYVGINGFSMPGFVATAPNGQLDFALMEAVRQSWLSNPEWELAIDRHKRKLGAQQVAALRERSRIWSETSDYVQRLRQETWASRQRSNERMAGEESRGRREVTEYSDPGAAGGTVELSQHYDHAYALRDGSYLLTSDANFDPWRDAGLEARKLEAPR